MLASISGRSAMKQLHAPLIRIHRMTPEQCRRAGGTLHIKIATHKTHFGQVLMASNEQGICALRFIDGSGPLAMEKLRGCFPYAQFSTGEDAHQQAAMRHFGAERPAGSPLHLHLQGSLFQLEVWESLLRIPFGQVVSYGQIARELHRPGAARAVGTAIGSNPVAVLIPCHRVLRSNGALGGYRWGAARKAELIAWESKQQASAAV